MTHNCITNLLLPTRVFLSYLMLLLLFLLLLLLLMLEFNLNFRTELKKGKDELMLRTLYSLRPCSAKLICHVSILKLLAYNFLSLSSLSVAQIFKALPILWLDFFYHCIEGIWCCTFMFSFANTSALVKIIFNFCYAMYSTTMKGVVLNPYFSVWHI